MATTPARIVNPARVAHHYLGLARSHVARIGSIASDVNLKKLFYLIRPIVALDWMEQRGFSSLPPMSLPECRAGVDIDAPVILAIRQLIDQKALTREMGFGPIPPVIGRYLEARYGHHEMYIARAQRDESNLALRRNLAENFYRKMIEQIR